MNWNFNIQREIAPKFERRLIGYVGSRSLHYSRADDIADNRRQNWELSLSEY